MQNQKIHNFQKSLKVGKKAENEFFDLFKDKIQQLDGYAADFRILRTGKTIELKTDSYNPCDTPNFFMEKFSYKEEPGGAFQALKKGTDYYVYWFPITMEFYVYKMSSLVDKLNELHPDPWLINIRNQAHVTRGFLVKRETLSKIRIPLEDIL